MKVMVLVKATEASEAGVLPDEAALRAMGDFNASLVDAGILLAGDGLHPSARGCRLRFTDAAPEVQHGPFSPVGSLVAGFWLWQVRSLEEAVQWLRRAPFNAGHEVEIRPVMGEEDFGTAFTEDLRAQEQRLRERTGHTD